uniref:Uncharacterized protein n=1 Tax=Arundo donax TaxID=35708 RepID=A0A0A9HDU0_ARUDO
MRGPTFHYDARTPRLTPCTLISLPLELIHSTCCISLAVARAFFHLRQTHVPAL